MKATSGRFRATTSPYISSGPAITWEVSIFLEMFEQKICEFLAFSHFRIPGQSVFMSFRGGINHQFCQGRFKWCELPPGISWCSFYSFEVYPLVAPKKDIKTMDHYVSGMWSSIFSGLTLKIFQIFPSVGQTQKCTLPNNLRKRFGLFLPSPPQTGIAMLSDAVRPCHTSHMEMSERNQTYLYRHKTEKVLAHALYIYNKLWSHGCQNEGCLMTYSMLQ